MADSSVLSSALTVSESALASANESFMTDPARALQQMVLRIPNAENVNQKMTAAPISVAQAMMELREVIASLQAPHSGFPPDQIHNPEAIAPYVTEEVEDLITEIRSAIPPNSQPGVMAEHDREPEYFYCLMEEWEPRWLWWIARSGYDTMRMLEGIEARVTLEPGQPEQSGILRLIAMLDVTLDAEDQCHSIDLVTYQEPPDLLADTVQLHTPDYRICHERCLATELLNQIQEHIQITTTATKDWFAGQKLQVLLPKRDWETAGIGLRLGLQFVPDAVDPGINQPMTPEVMIEAAGLTDPATDWSVPHLAPMLTFTDQDWVAQFHHKIATQQITQLLPNILDWEHLIAEYEKSSTLSTLDLVKLASDLSDPGSAPVHTSPNESPDEQVRATAVRHLSDRLNAALIVSGRDFPNHEVFLDDLSLRLLWCFNRCAEPMMQLMGGVSAQLLQPYSSWLTGTLRLRADLQMQTPELGWTLDLATGLSLTTDPSPPNMDSIVQAEQLKWCQVPIRLSDLHQRVFASVQAMTPEVELLMAGTTIDLLDTEHHWQPGTLQLRVALEFLPDSDRYTRSD